VILGAASLAVAGGASLLIAKHKRDDATAVFEGHTDVLFSVKFAPDGRTLTSGSMDRTIRLWDVPAAAPIATLPLGEQGGGLADLSYSPDGVLISASVGGGDGISEQIAFWNTRTRSRAGKITLPGLRNCCAQNAATTLLATGGDQAVISLWNARTLGPVGALTGHTGVVLGLAFSPDDRTLVSLGSNRTVRLWDCTTGHQTFVLHDDQLDEAGGVVAVSRDGALVAHVGTHTPITIWRTSTGDTVRVIDGRTLEGGQTHHFDNPVFSPDGRHIACSEFRPEGQIIRVFDTDDGSEIASYYGHDSVISSLDGRTIASASYDKTIRLWRA
jgi:WD40 repeat protein